jgi:hypothetical protein
MTTQAVHHQHPQQPLPYLQQQPTIPPGVNDDRSTSPTVIVTTSQVIKECVDSSNSSPSTAPVSSTNTTPLSGAGAAAAIYASFPNPVQSYYQQPATNTNNMGTMDGSVTTSAATAVRPTTPFQYHHSHPGSGDPLSSPMSASPLGAWKNTHSSAPPSTNNTPVPSEILTTGGEEARGPFPFFPSILKSSASSSNNSISARGNNSTSSSTTNTTKSVQVTGKKKHLVKSSASVTSANSNHPEDEWLLTMENGSGGGGGGDVVVVTARRQKRLERNRESARLSRRRRKQYLEVLEERVAHLSLEMDQGRRHHANQAITTICRQRSQVIEQALVECQQQQTRHPTTSNPSLDHSLWLLEEGPLARTSSSLLVISTFYTQQLKSFSLPSECKFTLWLTLQGDLFFRGGRAASERLSAARIGERVRAGVCVCVL